LLALGLKKGDHVGVWAANLPEWRLFLVGAAKAGLVLVTINPLLQAAEVEYSLKQGDVRALFFMAQVRHHDCLETMRSLTTPGSHNGEVSSERLPVLRYMCLLGAPPAGLMEQEGWRPTHFREMAAGGAVISDEELHERQASVVPSDPIILMYTSGTTGFPKGARLSHHGLVNNAALIVEWFAPVLARVGQAMQDTRICLLLPFFHVAGVVVGILCPLYAGGTVCPLLAFDPVKALQVVSRERCNTTNAVPTMLMAILQHPDFASYDLSSPPALLLFPSR